jgi:hypothetical protein
MRTAPLIDLLPARTAAVAAAVGFLAIAAIQGFGNVIEVIAGGPNVTWLEPVSGSKRRESP